MVKKSIIYIFIYTLLVGCNIQNPLIAGGSTSSQCNNYELDISAPDLKRDWKGYYHMEWQDSYVQTFTTLNATTGAGHGQYIHFTSDKGIYWPVGSDNFIESINHDSFTRADGTTNAVFCSWESMIDQIATVTATWTDQCGNTHTDKLKIVIHDDE
jgi:hypothetical protein